MKPQTFHTGGNVIVRCVGRISRHIIILHDGEISAPSPEKLSPCYAPSSREPSKPKEETAEKSFVYSDAGPGYHRYSDVATKIRR